MAVHFLPAETDTVREGVIDKDHPCVLVVDPGDTVETETWSMWMGRAHRGLDLDAVRSLRRKLDGRGPHVLTGPIHVHGAKPGDTLEVGIQSIELADHGFNLVPPGGGNGLLADRFTDGHLVHFELDTENDETRLDGRVTIPLRPFLGLMGVAPESEGRFSSVIPGDFGGNIDCPDLVAGTTLYLPVWQDGAGFYLGDAHAAQGCGEVAQTALETVAKRVVIRLDIVRDRTLRRPHAETPTHLITMGFDVDLVEAGRRAVSDMIEWIGQRYGLRPADAYTLCSLQADLLVTQFVNEVRGIHARLPKAIFDREITAERQMKPPDLGA